MQEAIEERVKRAIAEASHTAVERLAPETTFEELGMTSLDALALVAELEEEFGVEVPNEDALSLRDVRQAVECVRALTTTAEASEAGQV
ncbi:MAG: acyl carrier protein [Pyrinomonadaceae bacterium]